MVTNALTCVENTDFIIVLDNGKISEQGTFSDLISHEGPFAVLLREHIKKKLEKIDSDEDSDEENEEEMRSKLLSNACLVLTKECTVKSLI